MLESLWDHVGVAHAPCDHCGILRMSGLLHFEQLLCACSAHPGFLAHAHGGFIENVHLVFPRTPYFPSLSSYIRQTLRCCGNLSAMKVRVVPECMYKRCYKPFLSISMAYYVIWNMYGKRGYRVSKAELRTAKVDPYSRREKITFGGVPKSNTDTIFKIKTSHWLSGIFINIKYRSFNG